MFLIDIAQTDEMRKQLLDQIENRYMSGNSDDWLEEAEAEAKKKENENANSKNTNKVKS